MSTSIITIDSTINVNSEKVWNYWTEPDHITKWNFASDDWCCPSAENDMTIGGTYKARMEAKDGSFGFDFEAVYDEIIEHKKIVYTIADGRKVTTTFEKIDGLTKVTTTFEAESENPIEMQRDGWQAILNNFKRYSEKNIES
ncbi:MAG: SRPBCC family protein [Balneola sp.]